MVPTRFAPSAEGGGMENLMNKKMPIGVMDAGMGGLTVVKELQKLLPGEDIVFYGEG